MGKLRQTCKNKKIAVFVTSELGLSSMCFSRPLKRVCIAIHDDTLLYFCKRNVCCGGFCCFHAMLCFLSFGTKWVWKFSPVLKTWCFICKNLPLDLGFQIQFKNWLVSDFFTDPLFSRPVLVLVRMLEKSYSGACLVKLQLGFYD